MVMRQPALVMFCYKQVSELPALLSHPLQVPGYFTRNDRVPFGELGEVVQPIEVASTLCCRSTCLRIDIVVPFRGQGQRSEPGAVCDAAFCGCPHAPKDATGVAARITLAAPIRKLHMEWSLCPTLIVGLPEGPGKHFHADRRAAGAGYVPTNMIKAYALCAVAERFVKHTFAG